MRTLLLEVFQQDGKFGFAYDGDGVVRAWGYTTEAAAKSAAKDACAALLRGRVKWTKGPPTPPTPGLNTVAYLRKESAG